MQIWLLPLADNLGAESVKVVSSTPDIALWFLIGGMSAVVVYILVVLIREWLKK